MNTLQTKGNALRYVEKLDLAKKNRIKETRLLLQE